MGDKFFRVLLVEDDLMVQEVNRQFIEKVEGFRVVGKAGNGEQGMEKIRDLAPDLVILDIFMPEQDGLETLYRVRREKYDVDIIVVTAAEDMQTVNQALKHGAVDYILKPFKFERMKQALENYRLLRQMRSKEVVTQDELDQLLYTREVDVNHNLPKGLNPFTLKQVIVYLNEQKLPRSAEEVAEKIGIARVTARRYLDYLEKTGQVMIDLQYGGIGRPINRYVIYPSRQL